MGTVEDNAQVIKLRKYLAEELYLAFHRSADNFTAQLFKLIQKSDPMNKDRLRMGFPEEVSVFEEWNSTPEEKDFLDKYKVPWFVKDTVTRTEERILALKGEKDRMARRAGNKHLKRRRG